jgi:hypothetical protein
MCVRQLRSGCAPYLTGMAPGGAEGSAHVAPVVIPFGSWRRSTAHSTAVDPGGVARGEAPGQRVRDSWGEAPGWCVSGSWGRCS